MTRKDGSWQDASIIDTFLTGIRGGIPFASDQTAVMLRLLRALDIPLSRFMDIGCGDGVLAAAIAENFPEASGTLVDFSGPMLEGARERFKGNNRIRIVEADFGDPSWVEKAEADSPFDAIVSGFAIHHQNDRNKKRIYGEVFSLLAPGGLFLNIEHVASRSEWGKKMADKLFIGSGLEYKSAKGKGGMREEGGLAFFNRPDRDDNQLTPVEVQCEWLREAGFADVDCFFKAFELAVFGGRKPADNSL